EDIKVPAIPDGYLGTIPAGARTSVTRKKHKEKLVDDLPQRAIRAYYASITFADAQLGRILKTLDETGLTKNTIVVFTSDHGYHMGEHGHYQKTTLFENAARVPLVIAGPGVEAIGQTADTPAEMVDFYPTLAELAGLETPEFAAGVSLVPALKDASAMPRESALTQYSNGYSIRTVRYRYTEWGDDGAGGNELYDHQSDPEEMHNLAGAVEQAGVVEQLSRMLRARISQAKKPPAGLTQILIDNKRRVPQRSPKSRTTP
ncbi:MAG: sulfatase-like hydrolase/transferase, partial [Fuerstiella sp.]